MMAPSQQPLSVKPLPIRHLQPFLLDDTSTAHRFGMMTSRKTIPRGRWSGHFSGGADGLSWQSRELHARPDSVSSAQQTSLESAPSSPDRRKYWFHYSYDYDGRASQLAAVRNCSAPRPFKTCPAIVVAPHNTVTNLTSANT